MKINEVAEVLNERGYTVRRIIGSSSRIYRFIAPDAVYSVYTDEEDNVLSCFRVTGKTMNPTQLKKHIKNMKEE